VGNILRKMTFVYVFEEFSRLIVWS
jgi:hypothetical protein